MIEKNIATVQAYYMAMAHKDIAGMEQHLHPDMQLTTPLSTVKGKQEVLAAASQFFLFFNSLNIRATFGSGDQVMLVIYFDCPAPVGILKTAVLVTLKNGLIVSSELFHDTQFTDKN